MLLSDGRSSASATTNFLNGGGTLAELIQGFDWSATPLGPIEGWPQSLKTIAGFLLRSKVPIVLLWGPDGTMIYNDGYADFAGDRHPALLGSRVREGWAEVADFNHNVMKVGLAGGTLAYKDIELTLHRTGAPEQVWMNLDYSPVLDDSGSPAGVIAVVIETTHRVLADRRATAERERQRLMLSQMPGFVAMLAGPEHVYEYVNEAYVNISERGQFSGRRFRDVFPDLEGQGYYELLDEVYSTGVARVTRGMELHLHGNPAAQFIDFVFQPIRSDDGEVTGVFIGGYEVTEAQRAAIALRESEARLRFLDELGKETARLEEADAVLAATTRLVGEHLGISVCAYADMDEDQDGFTIRGDWSAPGSPSIVGHYSLAAFGKLAVANLGAGRPLIVNDNLAELAPEEAATFQSIGISATICMPLVKDGRLTALMAIHDKVPRVWSDNELAVIREVTERSWAHVERVGAVAELKQSEARLRALNADLEREANLRARERGRTWEVSPDLLSVITPGGVFESLNPAWTAALGWPREHLLRNPYVEFVHPDDLAATQAAVEQLTDGDPVLRFENRYAHADGGWRWLSWVAVPVEGKFYCSARDITAEKVATAERDRLWTLSEDMLARADYGGGVLAVNPAWTKVLGWSERELLSNPYADIINSDDLPKTVEALRSMGETGLPTRFENRILSSMGEWIPIGWTVAPEPGGVNFIAVGRDLSDYKARERELADAQEALRQSQKMEAVGQLTGGIAHDFNNLLAGIGGSLELLAKRIAEGRLGSAERYIDIAQTSTRRATALTQRLLAFSRRQTLDPKPTDMNRLVAGLEELIRRTVGPAVEVEVVGAGGLWLTEVDSPQLENAVLNLAINGRDAMPDGGRLTIETANKWLDQRAAKDRELPPGQYVSLCVSDTGTGMTPEVASRAFDPFFTTKPLGQGTGLGLSMIHGFVRQSGGQVRIYSELGKGTTMCLYLPRFIGELETLDAPDAEGSAEAAHGETVMVIDDEEAIRMLIADVLEEAGYRVLEAGDGPSGLTILQSDVRIDLLITDVGLPGGVNGRQVADAARITRPDLKVLFVTGYAENAVVGHGHLDVGMQVITKPFAMTALGARVREIIEG